MPYSFSLEKMMSSLPSPSRSRKRRPEGFDQRDSLYGIEKGSGFQIPLSENTLTLFLSKGVNSSHFPSPSKSRRRTGKTSPIPPRKSMPSKPASKEALFCHLCPSKCQPCEHPLWTKQNKSEANAFS